MKLLLVVLMALSFNAMADEGRRDSRGEAVAIAAGVQETSQNQNASNSQDVSVNTEAQKRNQVSTAYAPTVFPTAPCMGSSSVGGQGITFGFSIGSSWTDTECQIAETARGFEQSGYKEDALFIRCKGKYAKDSPSCVALTQ
jgi:hypothetical protein